MNASTHITRGLILLLGLAALTSCRALVRDVPMLRWMSYPPEVANMGAGLGPDTPGLTFDHSDYGSLLRAAIDRRGDVNYGLLGQRQDELAAYLVRLEVADRTLLTHYEQLAFLINAHNACTLQIILENPGIESILDIEGKPFEEKRWTISGETMSLYHLVNKIIRPEFTEARVHFALALGARSSPRLRNEPYIGSRLKDQLDGQARRFLTRKDAARVEIRSERLFVSELLDWYKSDFTAAGIPLRDYIKRYTSRETMAHIDALHRRLELTYMDFDWRLAGQF